MKQMKWVLLIAVAAIAAAAAGFFAGRNNRSVQDNDTQVLQSQCEAMGQELSALTAQLDAEKEHSAQLSSLLKKMETLRGGDKSAAEGETAAAEAIKDPALVGGADLILSKLQEENKRLRTELDTVKALLAKQTADSGAALKTAAKPTVQFYNAQLLSAYQDVLTSTSKVRTLELLESLSDFSAQQDLELIPILQQAMLSGDTDVCREAIQMLMPYQSPAILPVLEQAFTLPDEFTRLSALGPAENINDPQVVNLLSLAFNDSAEDVRNRALEIVQNQPEPLQLVSLQTAIQAPRPEVSKEAVSLLQLRSNKSAIEPLILGLSHADAEVRSDTKDALQFLVDQEFDSAEQAATWWRANQDRYDDDLFEK